MELALDFFMDLPQTRPITRRVTDTPPSFEQIVDAHYQGLYRFALSMCRRDATAQDLVQQTFLQWAKKGHSLRDASKVKTWLFTTLYREWLSMARREKKYEEVEFEPDLHGSTQDFDEDESPRVDSATLQAALNELDPHYRAPLVLFYLKELSYRDIAATLGIPIGTVMSRLSRAKDILRASLRRLEESTNILSANFNPTSAP
jgi:RNA polymerase sigma factor (sigma-70 family)